MTRLAIVAAAAFFSTTSAFAGDVYDFKIGGQSIHIEHPSGCNTPSCATISIPGVYESGPRRKRVRDEDGRSSVSREKRESADVKSAPGVTTAPVDSPAPPTVSAAPSLEPANGGPAETKPTREPVPAPSHAGLAPPTVAAVQPAATPAPPSVSASPIGLWQTEDKGGRVRIETCGGNLCGYAVDAKTDANGDKVLINLKPGKDKWTGRIHDPNSGSSYDSTIAMKGDDRLRVQGCAFGGMFCGGQTWTRTN